MRAAKSAGSPEPSSPPARTNRRLPTCSSGTIPGRTCRSSRSTCCPARIG